MARPDFIRTQLSATRALIKFIEDHHGGVDGDLQACLRALEREDIDSAVQYARLVKPWGMGSLTDWYPPEVQPLETREYNEAVLLALVNHWCSRMSLSFDELDRTQRDLQVGELNARVNSKGYALCPFCNKTFSPRSSSWDGSRHVTCGVRLRLIPSESDKT